MLRRSRCVQIFFNTAITTSLKKNQNAPRPSEHPPVRGENLINGSYFFVLGGIHTDINHQVGTSQQKQGIL